MLTRPAHVVAQYPPRGRGGACFSLLGLCFASWASRIPSIQQRMGISEAASWALVLLDDSGGAAGVAAAGGVAGGPAGQPQGGAVRAWCSTPGHCWALGWAGQPVAAGALPGGVRGGWQPHQYCGEHPGRGRGAALQAQAHHGLVSRAVEPGRLCGGGHRLVDDWARGAAGRCISCFIGAVYRWPGWR